MKYNVTLQVMGRKHKAEGKTLEEAVRNLKPGHVQGKAIVLVEVGDKAFERIVSPIVINRAFNLSPSMREVAIKQLTNLFNL